MSGRYSPQVEQIRAAYPEELWLLLLVLTGDSERQHSAWRQWCSAFQPDTASWRTKRQFPRVYSQLASSLAIDDLPTWLHRSFQWNQNRCQEMQRELQQVLSLLSQQDIPVMILKSMSLVALGIEPLGSRMMYDTDVLVPFNLADTVHAALMESGWQYLHAHVHSIDNKRYTHAVDLKNERGGRIDLHWNLIAECLDKDLDATFWENADTISLGEHTCYILNPSDLFFHICIHGYQRIDRRYDWAIDADRLVGVMGDSIDYDRVIALARERKLVRRLRICTDFLSEVCATPLPSQFTNELKRVRYSVPDNLEEYIAHHGMNTFLGNFPSRLATFIRLYPHRPLWRYPTDFLHFMRDQWQLRGFRDTLRRALRTALHIQLRRRTEDHSHPSEVGQECGNK